MSINIIWVTLALLGFIFLVSFIFTFRQDRAIFKALPPTGNMTKVKGGVLHWTKKGKGPAVILLHGLAGNMLNFRALIDSLSQQYTVYCLDRPGSGHSKRAFGVDSSFNAQSQMILEWMDKQSIQDAIFVGHSMGGAVSLNLAILAQHKVNGLALISPLTAPLTHTMTWFQRFLLQSKSIQLWVSKCFAPMIQSRIREKHLRAAFKPEAINKDFGMTYGGRLSMKSSVFNAALNDLSTAQKSLLEQKEQYSEIQCPVNVLYGEGDRILPCNVHCQMIEKTIPHANISRLENRGHMLPITASTDCVQMINDLQNQVIV